jgi:putative toxin-antitoxin system antitoxin component (TIGR02293 family)
MATTAVISTHASAGVPAYAALSRLAKTGKRTDIMRAVRLGIEPQTVGYLADAIGITQERMAQLAGISPRTLHRRLSEPTLTPDESDRVVRFLRLWLRAVDVLEGEDEARHWLAAPKSALHGETPLEYATTEIGAQDVDDLLGRIEHGVFT